MSAIPEKPKRRMPRSTRREVGAWLLALVVALSLWLSVNLGERASERTLRVRIDLVNLPLGKVITNSVPAYAQVRVRGSGLLLSSIDTDRMATQLDLAGVRTGQVTYSLAASDFPLPRNVDVTRVTPSRVSLDIDRLASRIVPVRLERVGEVRVGLELRESIVLPAEVEVEGPESQLANLEDVATQRVDVKGLDAGVNEVTVRLQGPGGLLELRRQDVRVQWVVSRQLATRVIAEVPIVIRNARVPWVLEPELISIEVRGPSEEISMFALNPSAVTVDATDIQMPGPVAVVPVITLPPGFDVLRMEPQEVSLRLVSESADPNDEAAVPSGERPMESVQ